ncbi:MAG: glycosyltransferase family 4 protein [Chloroflexia bacterium]|nr:glycosyltransferase family 4 protein [Chloroflexia bacterium]
MRIAYFSPLNPIASGISDYSEDLLPYLGAYAEIDLFIDKGYAPSNPDLSAHFAIHRYDRYPRLLRRRGYDVTLYHVGNSPAHDYILHSLERCPGVVVLHDLVLHHLMLWRAFEHGDGMAYHDAMLKYGEAAWKLALRMMKGQMSAEAFDYPLCEAVVQQARSLIVHSQHVAAKVRALCPELPLGIVPMGVPCPVLPDRREARRRLALPEESLLLASFGHINPYKRLEPALRAFRRLRESHPEALFLLVGSVSPHLDLAGLLRRLELEDSVRATGYAEWGAFLGYMAASDICLNLRYPTAGETSASLLRLLAAGLPTLVSRTGAFAELPAEVAIQVEVGEYEEQELAAFLSYLADQPEARRLLGENARRYVANRHTMAGAAAAYAGFLAPLAGLEPAAQTLREPLFRPQTGRPAPLPQIPPTPAAVGAGVAFPLNLVARALAEIGLQEDDTLSIRAVAEVLASLPELQSPRPPPDAAGE